MCVCGRIKSKVYEEGELKGNYPTDLIRDRQMGTVPDGFS